MKNLIRIAAISGSVLLCTSSFAQETPQATPEKASPSATVAQPGPATPKPHVQDGWKPLQVGAMVKQIGLTPDQTTQAKELNARYQRLYSSLPADMPLDDRKAKVNSMMAEREIELKKLLTPEQVTAYGQMQTRQPSGAPVAPKAKPAPTPAPTEAPEKREK